MQRIVIIMIVMMTGILGSQAQEKTRMVGIGYTSDLDTYLSPEHYSGLDLRLIREDVSRKNDSRWMTAWKEDLRLSSTKTRSEDGSELSALFSMAFDMLYSMQAGRLSWAIGGEAELFVGGTYNTSNGNNPAQLRLGLQLAPAIRASLPFRMLKKTMVARYSVVVPIVGAMFSPAYGQSYYEIFGRGNYDHNICLTSPMNAPSLTQQLTVSIPMKRKALTIGYLGDYRQAKPNSLREHSFTHSLLIGVTL